MPRVTQSSKRHASIDQYFQEAVAIWQEDARRRSLLDLWLQVVDHATRVVEAVRKERPLEVIDNLADTAMRLFIFVAKCQDPAARLFPADLAPSDLIWNKYPGICPACFDFRVTESLHPSSEPAERIREGLSILPGGLRRDLSVWTQEYSVPLPCRCLSRVAYAEERHEMFGQAAGRLNELRLEYARVLREAGHKPVAVADVEEMFCQIFRNSYSVLSLEKIAFHLLEEVGEVSQALNELSRSHHAAEPHSREGIEGAAQKLQEEVADVFSWVFACLLKIRAVYEEAQKYIDRLVRATPVPRIIVSASITFAEVIWSRYGQSEAGEAWESLRCPDCESRPCLCSWRGISGPVPQQKVAAASDGKGSSPGFRLRPSPIRGCDGRVRRTSRSRP